MRKITVIILLFIVSMLSYAQQPGNERFVQVINRLVEAMNNQDYAGIVKEYDKNMAVAFPIFKTSYFFKNNYDNFGKVIKIDSPQVKAIDQALCVMYFERGTQDLSIYIDNEGKIKGFLFATHTAPVSQPEVSRPSTQPVVEEQKTSPAQKSTQTTIQPVTGEQASSSQQKTVTAKPVTPLPTTPKPAADSSKTLANNINSAFSSGPPAAPVIKDKQQTELYPPFKGNWIVVAGGEVPENAAQSNLLEQQYSYEFSEINADRFRYKNNGKVNADYAGYGKNVIAPANGTVVEVIDGIRENSPGMRNTYALIGNAIIIQHTAREYSVLAFLRQGSIRVKVGDKITRGQEIAQCGNSGNATEPIIHFHLQDSPYLQNAKGIKFYFERATVTKDGKKELKLLHKPEIGEVISLE